MQVASIVGRAEVVSCIFYVLSFLSYHKGIAEGYGSLTSSLPRTHWGYVAGSIFLCACAMLSKEQGIVVIGVCATFDVILHWEIFWDGVFKLVKTKQKGSEKNETSQDPVMGAVLLTDTIGGVVEEDYNGVSNGHVSDSTLNGKKAKTLKRSRQNHDDEIPAKTLIFPALVKRLGKLWGPSV